MNKIDDLQTLYSKFKLGLSVSSVFIDWAIERLQADEEKGDLDIILLAAATSKEENLPLVERILNRYKPEIVSLEVIAGKEIASLHSSYSKSEISMIELDQIFDRFYKLLEYPNWLVMLSRNCEYATDIRSFKKPFEQEFEYIADLWASSSSILEFNSKYSRAVSNTHDV